MNGSDDIAGREQVLREWLRVKSDGYPTVFVSVNFCPNLVREIERFKKKQQRMGSTVVTLDEANRKAMCHAVETVEYAAAHGLVYVQPTSKAIASNIVQEIIKGRLMRARRREASESHSKGGFSVTLGPKGA
ncbi:MAG: hypothetical protein FJ045_06655 [Crenarchaeota archaeon]|nr:hypothetical protein [Thermoproteota archaeon]